MGYYLLAGFGAIITGIGYFIIYEPVRTRNIVQNITWEVTKLVSDITEHLGIDTSPGKKNYNSDLEDIGIGEDEITDDREVLNIRNTFIKYYNFKKSASYNIPINDKNSIEEEKKNMDVIFLKTRKGNEILYHRIEESDLNNLEAIEFNKVDKLFLQVELIDKTSEENKIIDIHHNLDKFYIDGNKLLDKNFLEWYLSYFYKIKLPEYYELRIFDKDINLISLGKDDGINISGNSYNKL